jgi:hypothetical protein
MELAFNKKIQNEPIEYCWHISYPPIFNIKNVEKEYINLQNALAFSFMDMVNKSEGNSTSIRNLYFSYSTEKEEHACYTFSHMRLHDRQHRRHIELNGCKRV